jgi:transcriptional regulator with XRE-family HTH domain
MGEVYAKYIWCIQKNQLFIAFYWRCMSNLLKENRKILNIQQKKIAGICDVSVNTVQNWEKGKPIPSDKLALLAHQGFDVQYIVTGIRSTNLPQVESSTEAEQVSKLELLDTLELIVKEGKKGLELVKKIG